MSTYGGPRYAGGRPLQGVLSAGASWVGVFRWLVDRDRQCALYRGTSSGRVRYFRLRWRPVALLLEDVDVFSPRSHLHRTITSAFTVIICYSIIGVYVRIFLSKVDFRRSFCSELMTVPIGVLVT